MRPQYKRIEEYIDKHGSITQVDASRDLGISKLSTRIGEMIKLGYQIKKEDEKGENRFGEPCHYKRYSWEEAS